MAKYQVPTIGGIRKVIKPSGTSSSDLAALQTQITQLQTIISQLIAAQNTGGGNIGQGDEGSIVLGPGLAGGGQLIGNVPIRLVAPIPWSGDESYTDEPIPTPFNPTANLAIYGQWTFQGVPLPLHVIAPPFSTATAFEVTDHLNTVSYFGIGAAGGVTIANSPSDALTIIAPPSGNAITVNNNADTGPLFTVSNGGEFFITPIANMAAIFITSTTTAGQSKGIRVNAGTNTADFNLLLENSASTQTFLKVAGDGSVTVGNAPTGGGEGAGTINVSGGYYVNGVLVSGGGSSTPQVHMIWDDTAQDDFIIPGPQGLQGATGTPGATSSQQPIGASWQSVSGGSPVQLPTNPVERYVNGTWTIKGVYILTQGGPGSCTVQVWKANFSSHYPPISSDDITGGTSPQISGGNTYANTTLASWTTSVVAGDVFLFTLAASTNFTQIQIYVVLG